MNRDELLGKLSEFLDDAMMGRAKGIGPDDDLQEKGLDSMGAVELVTMMEEEFGFEELASEEIKSLKSLNDAADLVLRKLEEQS